VGAGLVLAAMMISSVELMKVAPAAEISTWKRWPQ